ncbi:hypothetical protein A2U01_0114754, partial [Trifolium medium]|nr:hypothetical protein [Trifolium medium]
IPPLAPFDWRKYIWIDKKMGRYGELEKVYRENLLTDGATNLKYQN